MAQIIVKNTIKHKTFYCWQSREFTSILGLFFYFVDRSSVWSYKNRQNKHIMSLLFLQRIKSNTHFKIPNLVIWMNIALLQKMLLSRINKWILSIHKCMLNKLYYEQSSIEVNWHTISNMYQYQSTFGANILIINIMLWRFFTIIILICKLVRWFIS